MKRKPLGGSCQEQTKHIMVFLCLYILRLTVESKVRLLSIIPNSYNMKYNWPAVMCLILIVYK